MFNFSIESLQGDKTRIDKICSNDELKTWDISSFEFLVDICWHVLDSESENKVKIPIPIKAKIICQIIFILKVP